MVSETLKLDMVNGESSQPFEGLIGTGTVNGVVASQPGQSGSRRRRLSWPYWVHETVDDDARQSIETVPWEGTEKQEQMIQRSKEERLELRQKLKKQDFSLVESGRSYGLGTGH